MVNELFVLLYLRVQLLLSLLNSFILAHKSFCLPLIFFSPSSGKGSEWKAGWMLGGWQGSAHFHMPLTYINDHKGDLDLGVLTLVFKDTEAKKRYKTLSSPLLSQCCLLAYERAEPCKHFRTSSHPWSNDVGWWNTKGKAAFFKQAGKLPIGTHIRITALITAVWLWF